MFSCLFQPLSPSSQRRLKQLTEKHGSGKIFQVMGMVAGSRELDLNLTKGELVAVISEADTRGDRRRWLVDAGGENQALTVGTVRRCCLTQVEPRTNECVRQREGS